MNAALTVRPLTEIASVTDTRDPTLPPGLSLPSRRHRWWAVPVVVLSAAVLVCVSVLAVLPSSLIAEEFNPRVEEDQPAPYARTPASAVETGGLVLYGDLDGVADVYPADGELYLVTVTEPSQSVLSWLIGREHPAIQFLTEEGKFGFQTPQQRRTFALEQMRTSEQVAQYVALERVGYDVELIAGDVLIEGMVCLVPNDDGTECIEWSPSDDVLDPGDRVLSVEGVEIDGVEDLGAVLEGYAPGDTVVMVIDRPEEGEIEVEVELTASPEEPDRTIVGFYPFDTRRVVLPFELDIDAGRIGGPSAGLAFTLTLIDELTEGELTGGERVAVTGTIQLDGSVGAIGGLRQKASAVDQTGIELFIVPASQGEEDLAAAREAAGPDVEIVPVATLDEALAVLEERGGDPIPPALP